MEFITIKYIIYPLQQMCGQILTYMDDLDFFMVNGMQGKSTTVSWSIWAYTRGCKTVFNVQPCWEKLHPPNATASRKYTVVKGVIIYHSSLQISDHKTLFP